MMKNVKMLIRSDHRLRAALAVGVWIGNSRNGDFRIKETIFLKTVSVGYIDLAAELENVVSKTSNP